MGGWEGPRGRGDCRAVRRAEAREGLGERSEGCGGPAWKGARGFKNSPSARPERLFLASHADSAPPSAPSPARRSQAQRQRGPRGPAAWSAAGARGARGGQGAAAGEGKGRPPCTCAFGSPPPTALSPKSAWDKVPLPGRRRGWGCGQRGRQGLLTLPEPSHVKEGQAGLPASPAGARPPSRRQARLGPHC